LLLKKSDLGEVFGAEEEVVVAAALVQQAEGRSS
jgi:hypothetical protein